MVCKHGLDEINCPICRVSKNTIPLTNLNLDMTNTNPLKPENPFFKNHLAKKDKLGEYLINTQNNLKPNLLHEIPKPSMLLQSPNFGNKILHEKLEKMDIENSSNFDISKKTPLGKGELDLESKD